MKRLSLKWQIILLVASVVTVAVVSLTLLVLGRMDAYFYCVLEHQAVARSAVLAESLAPALERRDSARLSELARATLLDTAIRAIGLYDPDGREILGLVDDPDLVDLKDTGNPVETLEVTHTPNFCYIERPVREGGTPVGYLRLVVSEESFGAEADRNRWLTAASGLLVLVLSIVLFILVSRRVMQPISAFEEAATRVRSGDMESAIDLSGLRPDLRQLGGSFNYMQDALRQAFDQLHQARERLEQEVDDRTSELRQELGVRLRAEEALKESEEKYRHLIERAKDGITIIQDGILMLVNPSLSELLGYGPDELIGLHFKKVIPAEQFAAISERYRRRVANIDGPSVYETVLRHKSGRQIDVEVNAGMVKYQGEVGDLLIVRDISERKRAGGELLKSQQKLLLHVQQTPLAVIEWDLDFLVTEWNQAAENIFGFTREEALGHHPTELMLPTSARAPIDKIWCNLLAQRGGTRSTNENVTKSGKKLICEWYNTPLVDEHGEVIGVASLALDITEKVDAELALQEWEQRYRAVSELTSDYAFGMTFHRDGSTTLDWMTDAFTRISGYTRDEIIARGGFRNGLFHPDDRHLADRRVEQLQSGLSDIAELRIITKAGEERIIRHTSRPIWDNEHTRVVSVVTAGQDITEKVRTEADLRFTQFTVDQAADPAFWMNKDARFFYVNEAACRALGYSREELLHMSVSDIDPNFPIEAWPQHWAEMKQRGRFTLESAHQNKNGDVFPVEITVNYVDFEGEAYNCAFVRDISERKRHELAQSVLLRISEAANVAEHVKELLGTVQHELGTVIDTENFYVALYDPDTKMYSFPYHRDKYDEDNVPPPQALRQSLTDYVRRTGRALLLNGAAKQALMEQGEVVQLGQTAKLWLGVPLRTSAGTIGVLAIQNYEDPLAYTHTDADWLTSVADPIARVIERHQAQVQEQELRDKLDRAERMESLGVLAGGVAHDLNNMLGPLVGYPELMLMKLDEDSPLRKQVQRIGNSARDAADVVQDLLTLARRGRYNMVPLNLNEIADKYLDSPGLASLITSNPEVTVDVNLERQIGRIQGSSPHLSKVLMNLVVNAFDAMPDGGQLSIKTAQVCLDKLMGGYENIVAGDYVLLRVQDTGMGIDPKDIDKIFEPYYSKKTMGTSGSGLGLSVVYGVVKDHKGYYDIFSELGKGTEFVLYFPMTEVPVEEENRQAVELSGSESVLIIDDDETQREMATDLLGSLGYNVSSVTSGREAVAYLKDNSTDIILLDMIMETDFDGLDTYREICKLHPGQRAIIVSGYSSTDRVMETLKLGAGSYVRKPYTRRVIAEAIRAELDNADNTNAKAGSPLE